MVASRWILLSSFGASCLFAAPAHAGGKLISWSFDPAQNRLSFRTAEGVQPRAQLVPNPSRIVMDLPGTAIGGGLNSRDFNGAVRQVRVGQFDARTTRLVIELAPGYEVDAQQVRVRGASSTQWSVEFPSPRFASRQPALASSASRPIATGSAPAPAIANLGSPSQGSQAASPAATSPGGGPLQVTRSGILLRMPGGVPEDIAVTRNADRTEIEIDLPGITWPSQWTRSPQVVRQYGLGTVEFLPPVESKKKKKRRPARLRLRVNPESPNWRAISTRSGDLILVTQGGFSEEVARLESPGSTGTVAANPAPAEPTQHDTRRAIPPVERRPVRSTRPRPIPTPDSEPVAESTATLESVLVLDDNRLVVRGDRNLQTTNPIWDPSSRSYWVLVRDAVLSPSLQGPQLSGRGAIRQVRLLQKDARTVAIAIKVADGVRADALNHLDGGRILALDLHSRPRPGTFLRGAPAIAQDAPPRPVTPAPQVPRSAQLITIDPGHGGKDPGAIGIGGIREKDIVLDISQHLQRILSEKGLRVLMTRSDDRFISLQGRVDAANRANSDIFVSVHANAISLSRPDINGVETFYARGSSQGQALASAIQQSVLQRFQLRNRGVKRSGFFVLKHTDMPAALVEVGFVTGREDAPKLRDPSFRRQMAEAIADGILNYVRQSSGAR